MEVYLGGKINSSELELGNFAAELEDRGHRVTEKWWEREPLPKPYLDYSSVNAPAAKAMKEAVTRSEVCIIFPTDNVLGAAIEFGVAIASLDQKPDKKVILVNPYEYRQSVFYTYPGVIAAKSLAHVRGMAWY